MLLFVLKQTHEKKKKSICSKGLNTQLSKNKEGLKNADKKFPAVFNKQNMIEIAQQFFTASFNRKKYVSNVLAWLIS